MEDQTGFKAPENSNVKSFPQSPQPPPRKKCPVETNNQQTTIKTALLQELKEIVASATAQLAKAAELIKEIDFTPQPTTDPSLAQDAFQSSSFQKQTGFHKTAGSAAKDQEIKQTGFQQPFEGNDQVIGQTGFQPERKSGFDSSGFRPEFSQTTGFPKPENGDTVSQTGLPTRKELQLHLV